MKEKEKTLQGLEAAQDNIEKDLKTLWLIYYFLTVWIFVFVELYFFCLFVLWILKPLFLELTFHVRSCEFSF